MCAIVTLSLKATYLLTNFVSRGGDMSPPAAFESILMLRAGQPWSQFNYRSRSPDVSLVRGTAAGVSQSVSEVD